MTVSYEEYVANNWSGSKHELTPHEQDLAYVSIGLAGETGEVLEHIKKHLRGKPLDERELALECGDVLFYLTRLVGKFGFSLSDIQRMNIEKLEYRKKYGKENERKVA